ncbi:unnamed protein product [Choristocarpus tenellus]
MLRQFLRVVPRAAASRLAFICRGNAAKPFTGESLAEDHGMVAFRRCYGREFSSLNASVSASAAVDEGSTISPSQKEDGGGSGKEWGASSNAGRKDGGEEVSEADISPTVRMLRGTVVSDRMMKSVVVRVPYQYVVPKYGKQITRHSKIMAHDEKNECEIGDRVGIVPCRPLSKRKAHRVERIMEKVKRL